MDLRAGDQKMMATLHTFGAVQATSAPDRKRLERLAGKGLAELIPSAPNTYRLSRLGAAWVAAARGLDSAAVLTDPIAEGKKRLDRGLGLADDQAA